MVQLASPAKLLLAVMTATALLFQTGCKTSTRTQLPQRSLAYQTQPQPHWNQAEKDAASGRTMTEAEKQTLSQECILPIEGPAFVADRPNFSGTEVELPTQVIIHLEAIVYNAREHAVDGYPPLTRGGIGEWDLCGDAYIGSFDEFRPGIYLSFSGRRVRPGVSISEKYPRAHSQTLISRNRFWPRQRTDFDAGRYVRVPVPSVSTGERLAREMANDPRIDTTRQFAIFRGDLFLPID